MCDSPKEPKKTDPELTVHPAAEPSPETKAKIATELGQELSDALEHAVREHEGNGEPDGGVSCRKVTAALRDRLTHCRHSVEMNGAS